MALHLLNTSGTSSIPAGSEEVYVIATSYSIGPHAVTALVDQAVASAARDARYYLDRPTPVPSQNWVQSPTTRTFRANDVFGASQRRLAVVEGESKYSAEIVRAQRLRS